MSIVDDETLVATESDPEARSAPGPDMPIVQRAIGRYLIIGEVGRGGMGVVYRAYDSQQEAEVAVKTLQQVDPGALRRFKREFRALADISHPNLATLHGLHHEDGVWCLSMEWIRGGEPFNRALRARASSPERQRRLLYTLSEGISALHGAGWVHRDLKPSNVLVTSKDRTVVLDFGLAASLSQDQQVLQTSPEVMGTLAFMAPEQLAGEPLTPAADWYAFGVLLYQFLTGRLPFGNAPGPILAGKLTREPDPPSASVADVPTDLESLCCALLQREPELRPSGKEVMERLAQSLGSSPSPAPTRPSRPMLFFGRMRERLVLAEELQHIEEGRPRWVTVVGPSGIGKSALIRRFIEDLEEATRCWILAGRCYEQESLPFKALDPVIDELARLLSSFSDERRRELIPDDLPALATVFPVLEPFCESTAASADPLIRSRAAAAFKELLSRLVGERRVILIIDDLQWGDADSADLLAEALGADGPPVLFIGSSRIESEQSPFRRALSRRRDQGGHLPAERSLKLAPLRAEDCLAVAREILEAHPRPGTDSEQEAALIARESKGSPYLLTEMALFLAANPSQVPDSGARLDEILRRRMGDLPKACLKLLEVLAVAGHPVPAAQAYASAGVAEEGPRLLGKLRAEHFVQTVERAGRRHLDTYHDRIRESLLAHLDRPKVRDLHRRLATELERAEGTSSHALLEYLRRHPRRADSLDTRGGRLFDIAHHYSAADRFDLAFPYALLAAEAALAQGSPEISARLFLTAERGTAHVNQGLRRRAVEGLGDAMMLRGEYEAAADRYATALEWVERPLERARLAGKMGELAFRRGRLGEAEQILSHALRRLGARLPSDPLLLPHFVWELAVQCLHTWFPDRFLDRRPLQEGEVDLVVARLYSRLAYAAWFSRSRLRCAWSHLRGFNICERYEPSTERIQAYVEHAPVMTFISFWQRGFAYLDKAEAMSRHRDEQVGQAQAHNYRGVLFYAAARFRKCLHSSRRALDIFRRTGDLWELNVARIHAAVSLYRLGRLHEAMQEAQDVFRTGKELDDIQSMALALDVWAKASHGAMPRELVERELERPREDVQALSQLYQARGLCDLAEHRFDEAVRSFQVATRVSRRAKVENPYVAPAFAWLATAYRRRATAVAGDPDRGDLRRGHRAARKALRLSNKYRGDRPHALRELGWIHHLRGQTAQAMAFLHQSLTEAAALEAEQERVETSQVLNQLQPS